jgi:uncharacterized NAD(P)/FAD-binding protein YdhS
MGTVKGDSYPPRLVLTKFIRMTRLAYYAISYSEGTSNVDNIRKLVVTLPRATKESIMIEEANHER